MCANDCSNLTKECKTIAECLILGLLLRIGGMSIRSLVKKAWPYAVIAVVGFAIYYIKQSLPIIGGYGAKNLCSCVYVGNRPPEDVIKNELSGFLISLGEFKVDLADSSAHGSVFGLAPRKAIYRKGLGCTLISQIDEAELRAQKVRLATLPAIDQDTIPWPMGNMMNDTIELGVDKVAMEKVVAGAFKEPSGKPARRTRAIVVVYKGEIIAEKYADGFDESSRQMGWSMSKSLTNAIIGNMVLEDGLKLSINAPIWEWRQDERKFITMDHLMRMSSGLAWKEDYSGPSSATNMLFKSRFMGMYAADNKLKYKPGEVFYYSSGTTNILSRLIRQIYSEEKYYRFAYENLFYKIGMLSLVMEPDAGGTFVGSSYSYATARDWARFGLLFLNKGVWNGERLLPEDWIKYTTTPTTGAKRGEYGAQFWLNAGEAGNASNRMYPDVPTDLYWADGFEGQNVFIIPSKQLVVVKLSQTTGDALDDNQFLKDIISLLPN